jgi:hypothetical protein
MFKAHETNVKIDKLDFIKIKHLPIGGHKSIEWKSNPCNGRKYLQIMCLIRG